MNGQTATIRGLTLAGVASAAFLSACTTPAPRTAPDDFVLVTPEMYSEAIAGFSTPEAAIGSVRGPGGDPDGPVIRIVQPPGAGKPIQNPIAVDIRWAAQQGARIDLDSFEVVFAMGNRKPEKLTKQLRFYCRLNRSTCQLNEHGLTMVSLPVMKDPGPVRFEIHLADTKGRKSSKELLVRLN